MTALSDVASFDKCFEPSECIIRTSEKAEPLFILTEGWTPRHRLLEDGRKQIVNFILPSDIFVYKL